MFDFIEGVFLQKDVRFELGEEIEGDVEEVVGAPFVADLLYDEAVCGRLLPFEQRVVFERLVAALEMSREMGGIRAVKIGNHRRPVCSVHDEAHVIQHKVNSS